jgi:hypothetical protein
MKNLVFASLLLVGLSQATGCIISSDDDDTGVVHAEWNLIERLATDPPADNAISCADAGVVSIAVHSLPDSGLDCDPNFGGTECIDLFDCVDLNGATLPIFSDSYTVWVDALDANDNLIAESFSQSAVVSGGGDTHLSFAFPVDVGNFDLTWTLINDLNETETCASVGSGGISVLATPVLNQTTFTDNIFACEDAGGRAVDNLLGDTTVVVTILDNSDNPLGMSNPRSETLAFGNEVVDLGNFEFCFDSGSGPGC